MEPGPVQTWVLPSDLTAAFHARRHVEAACVGMPPDTVDVARLLVTELVSNAVLHGAGRVVLAVARDRQGLRVEVSDESPELPVVADSHHLMEHGAGLRMVAALASSWGTEAREDAQPGKRVWFALG